MCPKYISNKRVFRKFGIRFFAVLPYLLLSQLSNHIIKAGILCFYKKSQGCLMCHIYCMLPVLKNVARLLFGTDGMYTDETEY